jgi:hypothetical protein
MAVSMVADVNGFLLGVGRDIYGGRGYFLGGDVD